MTDTRLRSYSMLFAIAPVHRYVVAWHSVLSDVHRVYIDSACAARRTCPATAGPSRTERCAR